MIFKIVMQFPVLYGSKPGRVLKVSPIFIVFNIVTLKVDGKVQKKFFPAKLDFGPTKGKESCRPNCFSYYLPVRFIRVGKISR